MRFIEVNYHKLFFGSPTDNARGLQFVELPERRHSRYSCELRQLRRSHWATFELADNDAHHQDGAFAVSAEYFIVVSTAVRLSHQVNNQAHQHQAPRIHV